MYTKRKSKNFIVAILLFAIMLFSLAICKPTTNTYADTGPKPSVIVSIENLNGRKCYGTLLSYTESTGPASVYNPEHGYDYSEYNPESPYYNAEEHAIWKVFVEYTDPDGYYYLQRHWACHETGKISWTYYPPRKFKILLYFPDTQTFASSGIYESYAFHSYFSANIASDELNVTQTQTIEVKKNYDYSLEIISLLARIIITILIELGIAWLFGLRTKRAVLWVAIVNIVTQTIFNIALNVISYYNGALYTMFVYIPLEFLIFLAEAIAYTIIFKFTKKKTIDADGSKKPEYASITKCVLFSLVANIISFTAGFVLIQLIPGIF